MRIKNTKRTLQPLTQRLQRPFYSAFLVENIEPLTSCIPLCFYHELGDSIKASEKRLAEIAVLKAHIINYAKTRPVYDTYRKTGYDSEPDFSDLSKIDIAYTYATDEEIPIQVNVDTATLYMVKYDRSH